MQKFGLLTFVLLILGFQLNAQISNSNNCKQAYKDIMSLRFDRAETLLSIEKTISPDNPYTTYLENYIDFLKVFISEDSEIFDTAESSKQYRIQIIESISDTSPYKRYLLANMNLQWAVARLKFNEYFSAAIEINRAYRLIEANIEEFPEFYPNKITHGVLQIMLGLVPEKYNWILDLIAMKGSVEKGTQELYQVMKTEISDTNFAYLKEETLFYLGFIEVNINPDKSQTEELLSEIIPLSDSSLLFSYLSINILTKTAQNEKAEIIFKKIQNKNQFYPFYYLDYLYGEFCLQKLDLVNARQYYSKFLKNFKGKNYIKDCWRKMAWSYLLEEKTENYSQIISNVGTYGYKDIGKDKDAFLEYETGRIPNINLIKARLLFDGNNYLKADSVLNTITTSELNFNQQLERTYRKARIKHKTNNIAKAKTLYKSLVLSSDLTTEYYPANSALKLGEIYEREDSLKMAEFYYNKCSNMNFIQYENSIKSKAKEGKRRVSK
jgi:hypothetical protein